MPSPAASRDNFEAIRDYIQISAVLAGVKLDPEDFESVMFEVIQKIDPFYIAFPDEDAGFYPYLAQVAYAAVTTWAEGNARAKAALSPRSTS